jgi:hypothetical protein
MKKLSTVKEYKVKMAYKYTSLSMAVAFAVVGLMFLLMTNGILMFFNNISRSLGMMTSSGEGINFYLILAVAYMYLVTLIAWLIYMYPDNRVLPQLLINGKTASSILSFYMILHDSPYLIYITNGVIDGMIAVVMFIFYVKLKKSFI